ncbi:MAG: hypothetical protein M1827_005627 [Pycnora praestabilis]|nr:MAG: hypothetical protein M1827_005627 [Pycnora praestabilis]
MALSIIPLLGRMALVHVVLLYGTNNAMTTGFTEEDVRRRMLGSKLVLASRIMYAAFIWTAKLTVCEFLKRLTETTWRKSYDWGVKFIRLFLLVTFIAVVIATLTECTPFSHYWQVIPDPGAKCRQGYAQLLTMGAADVITDIVLVIFPIPIILQSHMPMRKKLSLLFLFALSLILVGITCYRVTSVIDYDGRQQYRSLLASCEILAAAAVSNALVLGSFVRDRGMKKNRYRVGSASESMERESINRRGTRNAHYWGSDEDLVRDVGMGFNPGLKEMQKIPRPAPMAISLGQNVVVRASAAKLNPNWQFPTDVNDSDSEADVKIPVPDPPRSPGEVSIITPRRVSFFDVGGLLEDGMSQSSSPSTSHSTVTNGSAPSTHAYDFGAQGQGRRGSRALLQDMGGFLLPQAVRESRQNIELRNCSTVAEESSSPSPVIAPDGRTPSGVPNITLARTDTLQSLQDVGGLLGIEQQQQQQQQQQR